LSGSLCSYGKMDVYLAEDFFRWSRSLPQRVC
jgi:hypothetical protein